MKLFLIVIFLLLNFVTLLPMQEVDIEEIFISWPTIQDVDPEFFPLMKAHAAKVLMRFDGFENPPVDKRNKVYRIFGIFAQLDDPTLLLSWEDAIADQEKKEQFALDGRRSAMFDLYVKAVGENSNDAWQTFKDEYRNAMNRIWGSLELKSDERYRWSLDRQPGPQGYLTERDSLRQIISMVRPEAIEKCGRDKAARGQHAVLISAKELEALRSAAAK